MITEYESYHLVKFKHRVQTSEKKTSERIEFVKVFYYNFITVLANGVVGLQKRQKIIKPQVLLVAGWLAEFLVNLLYDGVGNHMEKNEASIFMVGGEIRILRFVRSLFMNPIFAIIITMRRLFLFRHILV